MNRVSCYMQISLEMVSNAQVVDCAPLKFCFFKANS